MVENNCSSINSLFLLGKIEHIAYKNKLLVYSIAYAVEKKIKLSAESPIVCFTSNVLASVPLDDRETRDQFLCVLVYVGIDKELYPNIRVSTEEKIDSLIYIYVHTNLFRYIIDANCPDVLARSYESYYIDRGTYLASDYMMYQLDIAMEMFDCVFKYNNMAYATRITSRLVTKQSTKIADNLNLVWFSLACEKKKDYLDLIVCLYNAIHKYSDTYKILFSRQAAVVLSTMEEMKDLLCPEGKEESKFILLYNNFSSLITTE